MKSQKIIIASTEIGAGGLGSYLMNLIGGLRSRGRDVHLLVTNAHGNYFDEASRSFSCHDLSAVPLSPKKVLKAADLANSIMPDVILMNNCALMQYAIPLIDPRIKTISVLHSDDSRFYAIGALFSGRLFRWIAPTAGVAARFHKFVNQRLHSRIRVIPHGIDRSRFFPKGAENDGSARKILFVGFLGESKGANLLPDIFQAVAVAIPDSFLTIIGDGPLKAHLDSEFRMRGLQKRVLIQGATSPDETAKIMRASHILLLPTNLEGFGLVIVEAMMCGVVPVVSRLLGITDQLVQQGETGLLVTPLDIDGFVEAVKRIHGNTEHYQAMSLNARRISADTFSADRMLDRYESLFAEPEDRQTKGKLGMPRWYCEAAVQFLLKRIR
jgi:glycosyltransferase involved in cell wall biosynthesis